MTTREQSEVLLKAIARKVRTLTGAIFYPKTVAAARVPKSTTTVPIAKTILPVSKVTVPFARATVPIAKAVFPISRGILPIPIVVIPISMACFQAIMRIAEKKRKANPQPSARTPSPIRWGEGWGEGFSNSQ